MPQSLASWLLMLPGLLWLGLLMVVPCTIILVTAFYERGIYGGVDWAVFTFANFVRAGEWLYLSIFLDSARIAGLAAALALLIGYPAAYAIVKTAPERQTALLFLAMLPFWTNYLIRTYAWIVLLNPVRPHQQFPAVDRAHYQSPLPILYNEFAVILGLVYNYVPFVILAVYSALQRLDPSYAEASRDLGARRRRPSGGITLPLTAPGRRRRRRLCLRAFHRQFRDARPPGRRQTADGRQSHL